MHENRSADGKFSQWAAAASDRDLLARFVRRSDERAFAEIVRRHGPLVLGVCRRVLRDRHAAEDAFQATFLVLARSARSIRRQPSLASWLYSVAYRIARRSLAESHRRREQAVPMETVPTDDELLDVGVLYEQQLLDEELQELPDKYREPLVLHHLQGLTQQQVAERLGMSVAAVDGRLKRGRKRLKLRLLRRGVEFGAVLTAVVLGQSTVQAASIEPLIALTTQAAAAAHAGSPAPSPVSSQAARLAGKELTLMTGSSKLVATLAISAVVVTLIGLVAGNAASVAGAPARGTLPLLSTAAGFSTERTDDELRAQTNGEDTAHPTDDAAGNTNEADNTNLQDEIDQLSEDIAALAASARANTKQFNNQNLELQESIESLSRQVTALLEQVAAANEGAAGSTDSGDETSSSPERPPLEYTSSPSVTRIEEALDSTTSIEFPRNPLGDVVDYISLVHNVPILIDVAALADRDVAPDTEVELVVTGITLRDALGILLESVNGVPLDYVIEDEVMKITTRERAERTLDTRVYNLRSLPESYSPEDVARVVRSSIRPWTWRDEGVPEGVGGQADSGAETDMQLDERYQAPLETLADTLVVTQSQPVHREISDLLDGLGRQNSESTPIDRRAATEPDWWIEDALDEIVSIEFPGNPLKDVLDYISKLQNVPILIDEQGLSDALVTPRDEVSLVISGIKLRSALDLLLRDVAGVPLDYVVRHGTLTITTSERAERTLATRVYDVRDVAPTLSAEEVALTVRSTIRPGTWWDEESGRLRTRVSQRPGADGETTVQVDESFQASMESLPGALVITQSKPIHREIAELLKQLRHYHAEPARSQTTEAKPTIEDRLNELTYLQYFGAPLQDVLDRITRKHGVEFRIDEPSLSAAGMSPDAQVFISVTGVTLRSALDALWVDNGDIRLAWFVDDGMIHVTTPAAAATSITGLIRVHGDVPHLPPLIVAGDPDVRDASILRNDVPDRSLVVGAENGLANVYVFLQNVPQDVTIPPAAERTLTIYADRLQFFPRYSIARTGQEIRLKNTGRVEIGFHTSPARNPPIDVELPRRDVDGVQLRFDRPENFPVRLSDDLHPTRLAWLLPLDHPFADLTDESGRFNIRQLPPGEYKLTIWHERAGYLERNRRVTVPETGAAKLNLEFDVGQFVDR